MVELQYPFTGSWRVQNSPADRVPSHGTPLLGTSYAIDFTPVDGNGRSARFTLASLFRPEPPEHFVGFGRTVTAPVSGMVRAAHDGEADHAAFPRVSVDRLCRNPGPACPGRVAGPGRQPRDCRKRGLVRRSVPPQARKRQGPAWATG